MARKLPGTVWAEVSGQGFITGTYASGKEKSSVDKMYGQLQDYFSRF